MSKTKGDQFHFVKSISADCTTGKCRHSSIIFFLSQTVSLPVENVEVTSCPKLTKEQVYSFDLHLSIVCCGKLSGAVCDSNPEEDMPTIHCKRSINIVQSASVGRGQLVTDWQLTPFSVWQFFKVIYNCLVRRSKIKSSAIFESGRQFVHS